jgi:hypothetical protein
MIQAMNGQDVSTPASEDRLIKKAGRTIVSIVCVAFWLDCLADEDWPPPARRR